MLIVLCLSLAVIIFLVGNALRIVRFQRLPLSLRWELYPIPKGPNRRQRYGGSYFEDSEWWDHQPSQDRIGQLRFMAREVLALKSVREGFRELWLWSLLLHWGVYLWVAATLLGIAVMVARISAWPEFVGILYGLACAVGFAGAAGVLVERIRDSRLRDFTTRAVLFDLALLDAIFASGFISCGQLGTLVTNRLKPPAALVAMHLPVLLTVHLALVAIFLAYFPFTHMTHAYMKFFSWHGVRWDDTPAIHDGRVAGAMAANLERQVTWSAPHIAAETNHSWSEIAADAAGKGSGKHA